MSKEIEQHIKEAVSNLIADTGSIEDARRVILYGKSKATTDNMFNYITDKELEVKLAYLQLILDELDK